MDNFRDSYFKIDWDLSQKRLKGTFWGKQYDTGRGFAVTVINGGQVVTATNEVLRLKWEKPDNTTGYVNATIVNGKFIVENIDQMFTVQGSVQADFELSVAGEFVASITFYVSVEKAVAVDAIESSSDFTALQDALADVSNMQAQVDAVIANATVDSEVILARGAEPTLGARLDSTDTNIDEQRKQIYNHLYRFGNEYVEKTGGFVDGYTAGTTTPTVTKDVDHVNVNLVYSGGVANYGLVTAGKIDLTNISTLYIDWEQTTNNASSRVAFVASVSQNQPYNINNAIVTKYGKTNRQITKLDVSGLTGEYNIRVHGYSNNSTGEINYNIYQIYTDLELIDRTTLEVEATTIYKRFISTVYPVPEEVEGYWTPEILERQGGGSVLEVRVRLRSDSQDIHIKPENGAVDLVISWGDLKTDLSSYVKTINNKEYLCVPNNSIWVYSLVSNKFFILNRLNVQPKHIVILQNQMGLVVGGEALSWFISPYKFNDNSLPDAYILPKHLSSEAVESIGFTVPEAYKTDFETTVLDSALKGEGHDTLRFAFITDTHGEGALFEPMLKHFNIVKKMKEYGHIDFVAHGGDFIAGALASKNDAIRNLFEGIKVLQPDFVLKGNHDDNSYYSTVQSNIITNQEWFNATLKGLSDKVVVDPVNTVGGYCYRDFEKQKIRVVALNAVDYPIVLNGDGVTLKWSGQNGWGYRKRQLEWLRDEALNMPDADWAVFVLTHSGTREEMSGVGKLIPYNSDHVEGILKAFKTGTSYSGSTAGFNEWNMTEIACDFTAQGARDLIAIMNGHVHSDRLVNPIDLGINLVSTLHCRDTTNGAVDIVTINPSTRNVYLTRFGNGIDRQFTY